MRNFVNEKGKRAAKKRQKKDGRVNVLAILISVSMICSLMVPYAQFIEASSDLPNCGVAEHQHNASCYRLDNTPACGKAEGEDHTHTNACYDKVLACVKQEHTHMDACYSDKTADVEDPALWDAQFGTAALTKDTWAESLAAVAEQQVGYEESKDNYEVEKDGSHNGYTRYGDFADDKYGSWDTSFVNFCLEYAGIAEADVFPKEETDAEKWQEAFVKDEKENQDYIADTNKEDYTPQVGDIVFIEGNKENGNDKDETTMGIVTDVNEKKDEITVVEGDSHDQVEENTYDADDKHITDAIDMEQVENEVTGETEAPADTDQTAPDGDSAQPEADETTGAADPSIEDTDKADADKEEGSDAITTEDPTEEVSVYICGKEEHKHGEACYDEQGELTCKEEEHQHGLDCLRPAEGEEPPSEEPSEEEQPADEPSEEPAQPEEAEAPESEYICGKEEHTHSDACYDDGTYNLTKPLFKLITNSEGEPERICGKEEHHHDDACLPEREVEKEEAEQEYFCGQKNHKHDETCLDENNQLACELPEHEHGDSCLVEQKEEEPEYICGKKEHKHEASCYDEKGELTCKEEEHAHDDSCLKAEEEDKDAPVPVSVNEQFEYTDNPAFKITFHVRGLIKVPQEAVAENGDSVVQEKETADSTNAVADSNGTIAGIQGVIEEVTETSDRAEPTENTEAVENKDENSNTVEIAGNNEKLTFQVEDLEEQSQAYKDFVAYTKKNDDGGQQLLLQGVHYSLRYNGAAVDASKCDITAEITPTKTLVKQVEEAVEEESSNGYILSVLKRTADSQIQQVNTMSLNSEKELNGTTVEAAIEGTSGEKPAAQAEEKSSEEGLTQTEQKRGKARARSIEAEEDEPVESGKVEDTLDEDIVDTEIGSDSDSTNNTTGTEDASDEEQDEIQGSAPEGGNSADGDVVIEIKQTPNPSFTVQYYANLDRVSSDSSNKVLTQGEKDGVKNSNELPVIDTTGNQNGTGGNLPENSLTTPALKNIYISQSGDEKGKVIHETELTEVYTQQTVRYQQAPNLNYFDKLLKQKDKYNLKQIWVLKANKSANSMNPDDWAIYSYTYYDAEQTKPKLHFTNRADIAKATPENPEGYMCITDNATLRLVYDTKKQDTTVNSLFYDYDISSSAQIDEDILKMDTREGGINSSNNYKHYDQNTQAKFAFGNSNCGTNFGNVTWNGGHKLNAGNHKLVYKGCTFGLASGVTNGVPNAEGRSNLAAMNVTFSSGVNAPKNLFGKSEDEPEGKHTYDGKLTYNRNGDTFTLTTAKVGDLEAIGDLDQFKNPTNATYPDGTHYDIWTNNFWPMDNAHSNKRTDKNFGNFSKNNPNQKYYPYGDWDRLPRSDDGENHNSFFGMSYAVDFTLPKDYIGPLEYYFYGDDDMWVFLDGTLVCDIGGVHSSVGEYVDLWDYLKKGEGGNHTLSVFYTERGASGSSCWMQFTLPSVTSDNLKSNNDYGNLSVDKTVLKEEDGTKEPYQSDNEFTFELTLTDSNGTKLPDDYAYKKYRKIKDSDGNITGKYEYRCATDGREYLYDGTTYYHKDGTPLTDEEKGNIHFVDNETLYLVLHDNSYFKLGHDDYIIIENIPKDSKYLVKEWTDSLNYGGIEYPVDTNVDITSDYEKYVAEGYKEKEQISDTDRTASGLITPDQTLTTVRYENKFTYYKLPSTGGMGIYWYIISGILLMAGAALVVYKNRCREVLKR